MSSSGAARRLGRTVAGLPCIGPPSPAGRLSPDPSGRERAVRGRAPCRQDRSRPLPGMRPSRTRYGRTGAPGDRMSAPARDRTGAPGADDRGGRVVSALGWTMRTGARPGLTDARCSVGRIAGANPARIRRLSRSAARLIPGAMTSVTRKPPLAGELQGPQHLRARGSSGGPRVRSCLTRGCGRTGASGARTPPRSAP